ncbi:MAG: GMC family oxidoreductase [Anaerolineales bacterium]|nr:GMC family oxidoreductase [Anaerolineales bacterium]
MENFNFEAVVIGTGFGGAITSCRLSKKWPDGQVLILERGKRYPMASFLRSPHDTIKNLWNVADEKRVPMQPLNKQQGGNTLGVFDLRTYKKMDALIAAGFGGGSLIYSNVFMPPPDEIFDERWPDSCKKGQLAPYYQVAKEVLGARPVPQNSDPRREIIRTGWFQDVADELGRKSELTDINVFFGNDFERPLEIGVQAKNRYGAIQTSCTYCAECNIGCNTHSKNTLDLNYLFVAEQRYHAKVLTEHRAEGIVPLDANGMDDPAENGRFGYRVYYQDLNNQVDRTALTGLPSVTTRRVVVSAGCLGTTELLLRCRDVYQTLPAISQKLGYAASGNGDFLGFAIEGKRPINPTYGPVITQRTDFNLFENFDHQRAFLLEDGGYAPLLAWGVEGFKPRFMFLGSIKRFIKSFINRWLRGNSMGSFGYAIADMLGGEMSTNSTWLQFMGVDAGDGRFYLNAHNEVEIDWPQESSMPLYQEILKTIKAVGEVVDAKYAVPIATWGKPLNKNLTVHLLGGCIIGTDAESGVTDATPEHFGQVFGYSGLYVADGSIVPTAVGANPCATISAMSEMVAHGITGLDGSFPDAAL